MAELVSLYWLIPAFLIQLIGTLLLSRRSPRPRLILVVGIYALVVNTLFIAGFVEDVTMKTMGWAYFPMMVCSAPWSFLGAYASQSWLIGWSQEACSGTSYSSSSSAAA